MDVGKYDIEEASRGDNHYDDSILIQTDKMEVIAKSSKDSQSQREDDLSPGEDMPSGGTDCTTGVGHNLKQRPTSQ